MKESTRFKDVLLGLFVIATIGFGVYWFASALIDKIAGIEGDLGKTLVTSSVTILLAVISLIGGKLWEQKLKIREDIRAKKIPVYEKQIETFFSVFLAEKVGGEKPADGEIAKAFMHFTEKLIIWGNSDVIKAWVNFRLNKWDESSGETSLKLMEDLFLAIRKDLGNDSKNLANHELIRLFVNDLDTVVPPKLRK